MTREAIAKGETVEIAFANACRELGVDTTEAECEILEMPTKKTFGLFGGSPARVRAYIEENKPAEEAAAYLKNILREMGLPGVEIQIQEEEAGAALTLSGEDVGFIIGHRGETLDALQYLASLVANHVEDSYYRITLDVGNYREKRKETLEALGKKMAARAVKTGRNASLEPMNPYERRIIHTAVQTVEGAKSWSEGEDLARHVVIGPEGGRARPAPEQRPAGQPERPPGRRPVRPGPERSPAPQKLRPQDQPCPPQRGAQGGRSQHAHLREDRGQKIRTLQEGVPRAPSFSVRREQAMPEGERTIAAISTGAAPGGIGIVRISGPEARALADRVFRGRNGRQIAQMRGYTAALGGAYTAAGEKLDDVVALVFAAPKSYTGEDVVELSCHGGLYITRRLLQEVLAAGASPAQPGEFTRRAFLNGKMDLTQAEGGDGAHRRGGRAGRPGGPGRQQRGPCPSGWGPSGRSSPGWGRTWPPGRIFPRRTCLLWKTRPCPRAWSTPPRSFPGCWRASTWGRCTGRGCAP